MSLRPGARVHSTTVGFPDRTSDDVRSIWGRSMSRFWTLTGSLSNYIVVLSGDRALLARYQLVSPSTAKSRLGIWAENKREREVLEKIYAALPGNAVQVSKKNTVPVSTLKTVLGNAFLYETSLRPSPNTPSSTWMRLLSALPTRTSVKLPSTKLASSIITTAAIFVLGHGKWVASWCVHSLFHPRPLYL